MTQVLIRWEDADWQLDTEELTMAQAFVIKDMTKDDAYPAGRNIAAWVVGMKQCEPGCVRAGYWLMLQQNGVTSPIASIPGTFPVLKWHRAWATAAEIESEDPAELEKALAEVDLLRAKLVTALEAARAKAAPGEEGPTRPAGTGPARSPASASSTGRRHSAAPPAPREQPS